MNLLSALSSQASHAEFEYRIETPSELFFRLQVVFILHYKTIKTWSNLYNTETNLNQNEIKL